MSINEFRPTGNMFNLARVCPAKCQACRFSDSTPIVESVIVGHDQNDPIPDQ